MNNYQFHNIELQALYFLTSCQYKLAQLFSILCSIINNIYIRLYSQIVSRILLDKYKHIYKNALFPRFKDLLAKLRLIAFSLVETFSVKVKNRNQKQTLFFSQTEKKIVFCFDNILRPIIPEAAENFEQYYEDDEEHFPFAYAISIASFSLILFIEKIITDHHHDHGHDNEHYHNENNSKNTQIQDQNQLFVNGSVDTVALLENKNNEEQFKDVLNTQLIVAKKASFIQMVKKSIAQDPKNSIIYQDVNTWAPYILQIAVGIHAVFEGLSIGIQEEVSLCIGIALVVLCHKWAEGMTLGLAFRKAGVNKKTSTYMILIQSIMNPIGIGIGWIMADKGPLYTGIFVSISVGTFIYISTMETLIEEFSISYYKWEKYFIFLIAIAFVSSLWFVEQAVGGE